MTFIVEVGISLMAREIKPLIESAVEEMDVTIINLDYSDTWS